MKKFLAIFGTGFALGLLFAPESGKRLRARLWSACRRGRPLRYQWRDPEDRLARAEIRERMMDKTLADSFPASDPASSIPDPSEDSIVA